MRMLFLILLSTALYNISSAQRLTHIEVNAGFNIFSASLTNEDRFRRDAYMPGGPTTPSLRSEYSMVFGGVRGEFTWTEKLSITAGLRYIQGISNIESHDTWTDQQRFFFYRFREEGTTTEFVRIDRMTQYGQYAGVPIDVKYYFWSPRRFNLFVRAGGQVNILIDSDTEIRFHDHDMEIYEKEVASGFREPDGVTATLMIAGGLQAGKPGRLRYGFEIPAPTFFITTSGAGFVEPSVGGGIVVFVSIPLNRTTNE